MIFSRRRNDTSPPLKTKCRGLSYAGDILPPSGQNAGAVGAFESVAGAVFLVAAAIAAVVFAVASVEVVDAPLVAASVHRRKPGLHAVTTGFIGRVDAIPQTIAHLENSRKILYRIEFVLR